MTAADNTEAEKTIASNAPNESRRIRCLGEVILNFGITDIGRGPSSWRVRGVEDRSTGSNKPPRGAEVKPCDRWATASVDAHASLEPVCAGLGAATVGQAFDACAAVHASTELADVTRRAYDAVAGVPAARCRTGPVPGATTATGWPGSGATLRSWHYRRRALSFRGV